MLKIRKLDFAKTTTLYLSGRIDLNTSNSFRRALNNLNYSKRIVLDFSNVDYVTAAGLRELAVAQRRLESGKLIIRHTNRAVTNVLASSGMIKLFEVQSDNLSNIDVRNPSFDEYLEYRTFHNSKDNVLFSGSEKYNWEEINSCAKIIAYDLAKQGVRKGTHVAIFSRNSINWFCTFYAIQKLGAIAVLLNFSLRPNEVKLFSQIGDITHLCIGEGPSDINYSEYLSMIDAPDCPIKHTYDIRSSVCFKNRFKELESIDGVFTDCYDSDDASVMLFTSGTTGMPKGVLYSTHDVIAGSKIIAREMHVTKRDRICLFLPLCHVFGLGTGLGVSMLLNLPIFIPDNISDAAIIDTISNNKCTIFNSVPTKLLSIVNSDGFCENKIKSLRCSMIGGAPISEAQLSVLRAKMPKVHFMSLYGMTEIAPISMVPYNDTVEHITSTVGKPVKEIKVKIIDHTTNSECPIGTEGEIVVKSPTSMICYYNLEIEKQAINYDGWIPTGDLGLLTDDGYLKITGRIKDLIIKGGENISPKEIVEAISQSDDVADAVVVGVPSALLGEEVAAAVIMKNGKNLDKTSMREYLSTKLSKFKIPRYIEAFDSFPLLANGKVNVLELKKKLAEKL